MRGCTKAQLQGVLPEEGQVVPASLHLESGPRHRKATSFFAGPQDQRTVSRSGRIGEKRQEALVGLQVVEEVGACLAVLDDRLRKVAAQLTVECDGVLAHPSRQAET